MAVSDFRARMLQRLVMVGLVLTLPLVSGAVPDDVVPVVPTSDIGPEYCVIIDSSAVPPVMIQLEHCEVEHHPVWLPLP